MDLVTRGSLVLLAWFDSADGAGVQLAAAHDGRPIEGEAALAQLFPGGLDAAAQMLPWLDPASRAHVPMCAYAAVTDDTVIRSGFALHPSAADVARLRGEFNAIASVAGARTSRLDLNVLEGTAYSAGHHVALSGGEYAVLAAIALNHPLSREELCDKVWPDRDAESSARLLKVYVHRIRAKFGAARVIDTHGDGYRLGPEVRVDVLALRALARDAGISARLDAAMVARLQRAFEGIKTRGFRRLARLEQYDEWEQQFIALGVELARIVVYDAFACGHPARALAIAEDLVALDPYDDVAAELLIRAQIQLGRPDAASRHYRTFCRTLHEELDLPPPLHLARLLQA